MKLFINLFSICPMVSKRRSTQAAAVVIVIGIGLAYNLRSHFSSQPYIACNKTIVASSDSTNTKQASEPSFFIYAERVIAEGVKHFISKY